MSFNVQSWGRISSSANNKITTLQSGSFVGAPNVFTYVSASDTVATISSSNYFSNAAFELNLGDFIYAVGSDTTIFLTVATLDTTVVPPTVTTSTGVVTGDVLGPASATDNDIAVFDGATGKIIKDGGVTIGYVQRGGLVYAADAGATDAYAITLSPVPAAYVAGFAINFKANTANTGTATLNVNGLGAKTILKSNDQTLATGDIEAGQIVSVVYDGTNFQMQSQTALTLPSGASGTVLQGQGLASNPAYSTATYPATTTINQLLYSSAANTVAGLATANSAALVTTSAGVPVLSSTMTDGQVIIGSTGATPTAATLTAGANVTITNAAGSITIAASGNNTWVDQTTTPVTMVANTGYIANNAGLVTLNMPATAAVGEVFEVAGQGAGGWLLQMNTGQVANLNSTATTSAGSLASTNRYNCIKLVCTVANTTFTVLTSSGTITVA